MNGELENIIKNIQNKLTIEGKKRVFEDGYELSSTDLNERQDAEEFTRGFLIDKILFDIFNVNLIGRNRTFIGESGKRKVDYAIKFNDITILIEAKPINADLYDKSPNGAVNQIIRVFRLGDARDKFDFGIATDGLKWIFISNEGNSEEFDIQKDFNEIKKRIVGEEKILQKKMEDISKKFYEQYNDIIHGVKRISKEDCLVNSILHVDSEEDREEIAQVVIDRLIFIKFLEAKGIIKEHVLDFLYELEDHELNLKLNQLFFEVMSTKEKERGSVDPHFVHIPYLNGSLFDKLDVEKRNPNYRIRAKILHKAIEFLNKFKFVHHEYLDGNGDFIDPEILGYIFERAMNATDRKGTGAYYTPKEVTKYMAENALHPLILERVNKYLLKEKKYKQTELLKNIEEIFILRETTLKEIWQRIILKINICDNACGSGAFLLAVANILFDFNKKIASELKGYSKVNDIALKRMILKQLYGVDINPRAIEIAMLRLWLWLVESYKPENIEPLPNIEYNLRVGNSLLGYIDIEQFGNTRVTLDDFSGDVETTKLLLNKFRKEKDLYRKASGEEARKIHEKIEAIRKKVKDNLDLELYREICSKHLKIDKEPLNLTKEEYHHFKPFHYGFEFYEVFDLDLPEEKRGFDIVIGNPPYINIRVLSKVKPKEKPVYKEYYKSSYKNYDIYVLFFESSLNILKKGGMLSYITSNKFCATDYGYKIREILLNFRINKINDVSKIRIFEDAGVYPNITIIEKNEFRKKDKLKAAIYLNLNEIGGNEISILQNHYINDDELIFYIADKHSIPILEFLIENNEPLKSFGAVNSGTPGYNYSPWGGFITENPSSDNYLKFISTGNISKFKIDWNKPINYLSRKFTNAYMEKGSVVTDGKWNQFKNKKIMVRGIANYPTFAVDNEGYAMATGTYSIIIARDISMQYLTGVLNSNVIQFFYLKKYLAKHLAGEDIGFNVGQLDSIPIPDSNETQRKIIELISESLSKTENPEESFLFEILNYIVYELFFKDKIQTNLITSLMKYTDKIKNSTDLLKELKSDKKIKKEIEKIKKYKWVNIIEESLKN